MSSIYYSHRDIAYKYNRAYKFKLSSLIITKKGECYGKHQRTSRI